MCWVPALCCQIQQTSDHTRGRAAAVNLQAALWIKEGELGTKNTSLYSRNHWPISGAKILLSWRVLPFCNHLSQTTGDNGFEPKLSSCHPAKNADSNCLRRRRNVAFYGMYSDWPLTVWSLSGGLHCTGNCNSNSIGKQMVGCHKVKIMQDLSICKSFQLTAKLNWKKLNSFGYFTPALHYFTHYDSRTWEAPQLF